MSLKSLTLFVPRRSFLRPFSFYSFYDHIYTLVCTISSPERTELQLSPIRTAISHKTAFALGERGCDKRYIDVGRKILLDTWRVRQVGVALGRWFSFVTSLVWAISGGPGLQQPGVNAEHMSTCCELLSSSLQSWFIFFPFFSESRPHELVWALEFVPFCTKKITLRLEYRHAIPFHLSFLEHDKKWFYKMFLESNFAPKWPPFQRITRILNEISSFRF